jgi:hypothetical protein
VPRSSSYYRARQRTPIVDELLVQRITRMIDDDPCLGYRMFWARLRGIGIAKTEQQPDRAFHQDRDRRGRL